MSNDYGSTDFVRLIGPAILNPQFEKTTTICLDHLQYSKDNHSFNISNLVLSFFNISILISREKIDSSSFNALKALKARYPDIRIIVDIDDDLYSIPTNHPEFVYYISRINTLDDLIDLSDIVTVSTKPIEQQIIQKHPHVSIIQIPNFLNDYIWDTNCHQFEENHNEIRILYSGTETHDADLRLLESIIPETIELVRSATGKKLRFIIVGGTSLNIGNMEIIQVPNDKRSYPDYVAWLQSMHPFDFAIAPLDLNNKMNKSKSSLKFLEYSAMGLPAIYTEIEPYSEVVNDHSNGIIVPGNDLSQWKKAIIELATNSVVKQKLARNCKESLLHELLLSDHYFIWKKTIEG